MIAGSGIFLRFGAGNPHHFGADIYALLTHEAGRLRDRNGMFISQEARVRRDNAVFLAQANQLIHQLIHAAMQLNRIEQRTDVPRRPELLNKTV